MSFLKSIKNFFSEQDSAFGVITNIQFKNKIDYEVSVITDIGEEEIFLLEDKNETLKVGMKIFIKFFSNSEEEVQKHILKWKICDAKAKTGFFLKFLGHSALIFIFFKLMSWSSKLLGLLVYIWVNQGFSDYRGIILLGFSTFLAIFMFYIFIEQLKNSKKSFNLFTESIKKEKSYIILNDDSYTPPYNRHKIIKYAGLLILVVYFVFLFIPQPKVSKGQAVSLKETPTVIKPTTI